MAQKFDSSIRDSQGTHVEPINVENFDLDEYAEYEESLLERNRKFFEEDKFRTISLQACTGGWSFL